jgi:ornithine cyclodeaminase/alanine dehydrogenase-like protein (mu-crystallin family)
MSSHTQPSHTPLYLTEEHVRSVLTYSDLIPVIRQSLRDFSAGRIQQPVRTILSLPDTPGWFATMPAVYGDVLGAKLVTAFPNNAALGIHTHNAIIQLFSASTGEPLAILDGRLITEMRTAAVSAIAIDLLAPQRPLTLAILGSGVQARSHLAAFTHVREIKEIRVWSRNPIHAQTFADEISAVACTTAEQAVTNADVILTATSSTDPILLGRWLQPTALVCAVGSCTPNRRELDTEAMRGPVIVDSREAALKESGDILQSNAIIAAEIGELLNGASLPQSPHPTIFKTLGIAATDIAAARLVHQKFTTT